LAIKKFVPKAIFSARRVNEAPPALPGDPSFVMQKKVKRRTMKGNQARKNHVIYLSRTLAINPDIKKSFPTGSATTRATQLVPPLLH
jgi:hypothetical protein